MKLNRIFLIFVLAAFWSCHRDDIDLDIQKIDKPSALIYEQVNATVYGYVYDEAGQPVANALVQMYSTNATTNAKGLFVFKAEKMDQLGTYIRVIKEGYLTATDYLFPKPGSKEFSYIRMIRDKQDKYFESSVGGTISLEGGGTITFPPNAIKKEDGGLYSGKVTLTARFIDPTSPHFGDEMPGGLMGIDINGNRVVMGTGGMFAVELRSPSGEKLNLREGSKAEYSIPARSKAKPASMPTWWFDVKEGLWKEEGRAVLVNGHYTGQVSHFSFWNVDAKFDLVRVCGTVVDSEGKPMDQAIVVVEAKLDDGKLVTGYGYTDVDGNYCGWMPKGVELHITVRPVICPDKAKEVVVGPFYNNASINNIVVDAQKKPVSVKVTCNGVPAGDAIVVLEQNGKTILVDVPNGVSTFNLYNYTCDDNSPISIFGFEQKTGKTSSDQAFNFANGVYEFDVCQSGCSLSGVFITDCDPIIIKVSGGSGQYKYQWNTGDTTDRFSIKSADAKLYSVTVTDIQNPTCSQVFTKNLPGLISCTIELTDCHWPISLRVKGSNYNKIKWSNGHDGVSQDVQPDHTTTYSVTVTNEIGCSSTASIVVDPDLFPYVSSARTCSKNLITLPGRFKSGTIQGFNGFSKNLNSPSDLVDLNIFETGYVLWGYVNNGKGCEQPFEFNLPQYDGLKVLNFSTGNVIDGNIIKYTASNGSCYNCDAGDVAIFKASDLNTDLVQLNATGLPGGEYYVVLKDANSGCFVAFVKVKII
jgi:hypothetical protein